MSWRQTIERLLVGEVPTVEELATLLSLRDEEDLSLLYAAARRARDRTVGPRVFFYGFLYFSTICENRCSFCFYRAGNPASPRYRKDIPEVVRLAGELAESGVHLLDLTMGEDPYYRRDGFREFEHLVREVKAATGLPLMISPGVVPAGILARLRAAGADWFALYQETHNPSLYEALRPGQDYGRRWQSKLSAQALGFFLEEGVLIGIGESPLDRARSILTMRNLGAAQLRAMSFVPQPGTPRSGLGRPDPREELAFLAVSRLVMPDRLIPASLDIEGIAGLKQRLLAGANVVTSLIPPGGGLAGVTQSTLDIADGHRTVAGASRIVAELGLKPATPQEYREYLADRRAARTGS